MSHLTVEKLNTENRDAALSLINEAYDNVHGFEPLAPTDLDVLEQSGFFALGFMDDKLISFAYGAMVEEGLGEIRWAGVPDNFRGECHSLPPMQECISYLRGRGAKQIGVSNWLDAPYRQMLSHFEREEIEVKHDHLILRLDMRNYTRRSRPRSKLGITCEHFEKTMNKHGRMSRMRCLAVHRHQRSSGPKPSRVSTRR